MWSERVGVKEEDTSFKLPNFLSMYAQIRFLKQVEHSAYIIATSNANFDQEESFKEEV